VSQVDSRLRGFADHLGDAVLALLNMLNRYMYHHNFLYWEEKSAPSELRVVCTSDARNREELDQVSGDWRLAVGDCKGRECHG
jgi:hypothetical protein